MYFQYVQKVQVFRQALMITRSDSFMLGRDKKQTLIYQLYV